tara:strand:+ start:404 stop:910 length:507 start_codon:yes stop_codon:yes gene_type:complete
MNDPIVNRIANSALITIDLADYAPVQSITDFDLKDFLFDEIYLKEKDFREKLKSFNFSLYNDKIVALHCSSDAVLPMWSYMLVTSYLNKMGARIHFGMKKEVFQQIFTDNIDAIDSSKFKNKRVIIKGCGQIPLTASLYIAITKKLQNSVRSLMFGEACSAVPVLKNK